MKTKEKLKIPDFSSIYSPQSKTYRERIFSQRSPRFNRSLSPNAPNTPRGRSHALSTQPDQKPRYCRLQHIDQFKRADQLSSSIEKITSINLALEVEQASRKQYDLRMKTEQQYLKYNRNPLLQVLPPFAQVTESLEKRQKTVSIFEAISKLNQTDLFQKLRQKSKRPEGNSQTYLKTKKKLQFLESLRQKTKTNDSNSYSGCVGNNSNGINQTPTFQELDDIIAIREDNFFWNKRNKEHFNIFEVLFNPGSSIFQSGRQQLLKLNFCFDSMSSLCQSAVNQKFLRALSAYARMSIVNSYSKSIPEEFKINHKVFRFTNLEAIQLDCIFQVAQGQISPEVLAEYLTDEYDQLRKKRREEKSQAEKLEVEKFVPIRDTDQHAMINHQVENIDKTELTYMKNQKPTNAQKRQQKVSAEYLNKMKEILKKQLTLLGHTIGDRRQQLGLQREKIELLMSQLEADRDPEADNQKKIRMNKVKKEQTEKIKVRNVSKNFRQLKEAERLFNARETFKGRRPKIQSDSKPKSSSRIKSPLNSKSKQRTQSKRNEQSQSKSKPHSKSKPKPQSHQKSKPKISLKAKSSAEQQYIGQALTKTKKQK